MTYFTALTGVGTIANRRDKMKKFKFSYNYKGVDKWVIIEASNEEDAYRRFVFAYMHCDVEEVKEG